MFIKMSLVVHANQNIINKRKSNENEYTTNKFYS